MANSLEKLGKLSIALLEGFLRKNLGDGFVTELRVPVDKRNAIHSALRHVESRFLAEFKDNDLARAITIDLPANKVDLNQTIERFIDHPTDPEFTQKLTGLLLSEFKGLSQDRINSAVRFYTHLLIEELSLADEGFGNKIIFSSHLTVYSLTA